MNIQHGGKTFDVGTLEAVLAAKVVLLPDGTVLAVNLSEALPLTIVGIVPLPAAAAEGLTGTQVVHATEVLSS